MPRAIRLRRQARQDDVVDVNSRFLVDYYEDPGTWQDTFWMGVPVWKCPFDLWIYQEIITETRPDLIVEAGTYRGGSALYMASMCDLVGHGDVVTIDVTAQPGRPDHPRITYLQGSSTAPEVLAQLAEKARSSERVMVVLDSDHSEAHVFEEIRLLGALVTPGCYLVVEDTIVNGNPVLPNFGAGPGEAVSRFLSENPGTFEVDKGREKLHLTFNRGGYLRRVG
ncbi:MAG TPA: CmcI family methyltransferase [Acidimicrobiales bacterium]|nr:CmcI family methyltransferase [Acidimicrobiales bacterium]